MKKANKIFLFCVFFSIILVLFSCNKNNDPSLEEKGESEIVINNLKVGRNDSKQGTIKQNLHVHADIKSLQQIKTIETKILSKDKKTEIVSKVYNRDTKQTEFITHNFIIPEVEPGDYSFVIKVTDASNETKEQNLEIKLILLEIEEISVGSSTSSEETRKNGLVYAGSSGNAFLLEKIKATNTLKSSKIILVNVVNEQIRIEQNLDKFDLDEFNKQETFFSLFWVPKDAELGEYNLSIEILDDKDNLIIHKAAKPIRVAANPVLFENISIGGTSGSNDRIVIMDEESFVTIGLLSCVNTADEITQIRVSFRNKENPSVAIEATLWGASGSIKNQIFNTIVPPAFEPGKFLFRLIVKDSEKREVYIELGEVEIKRD